MAENITVSTFPNEPIGLLPGGPINLVKADDRPFRPEVYDRKGRLISDPDDERSTEGKCPTVPPLVDCDSAFANSDER